MKKPRMRETKGLANYAKEFAPGEKRPKKAVSKKSRKKKNPA